MVFWNDCEYLAWHALVMGWQFGEGKGLEVKGVLTTFLDGVKWFRGVAEGVVRGMMVSSCL